MRVYIAEPMDSGSAALMTDEAGNHVGLVCDRLGAEVFRPRVFWRRHADAAGPIRHQRNVNELMSADILVAVLPAHVTSIGVPIEIYLATEDKKPVLVYRPGETEHSLVLQLMGAHETSVQHEIRPWLADAANYFKDRTDPFPGAGADQTTFAPGAVLNASATAGPGAGSADTTATASEPVSVATGYRIRDWTPEKLADFQRDLRTAVPVPLRQLFTPTLRYQSVHELATLSRGPFMGDCGLDLCTVEDLEIEPGQSVNARTGVCVALPPSTFGWIVARSSTWSNTGLIVLPGVIDEGWRGELRIMVHKPWGPQADNVDPKSVRIKAGVRLAQLLVLPNLAKSMELVAVGELPPAERGEMGFGSSGQ